MNTFTRHMRRLSTWLVVGSLGLGTLVWAAEDNTGPIRQSLAQVMRGLEPDAIKPSPIPGLFEVTLGPRIFYMSADGRYMVQGSLVDMTSMENLTENSRSKARLDALAKLGEASMIVFSPEPDKVKHTVNVFTDVDCGYCRKLHGEIEGYKAKGIKIRYLSFPRAGIGSPSYETAVSIWCADDRNQAMTVAKSGGKVEKRECENPVAQQMLLGELMGVTGTPALLLEDGELLPGYVPPERLATYLDTRSKAKADDRKRAGK